MSRNAIYFLVLLVGLSIVSGLNSCIPEAPRKVYLNLSDTVAYVGGETCRSCHYDKHKTFSHTGMGQSFGMANPRKSSAVFHEDSILYDAHSDLYYHPYWSSDSLMLHEYRLLNTDTVHKRTEGATYIIGSGQHTNSHISNANGYLHQLPFTYYTQNGKLDLPPGFEDGFNTRFNRKIGLECMSCHNSFPEFVLGSENKFEDVPMGISCERCHGPGEIHVAEKMKGVFVDTATAIDYTIVNPGNLSSELQFDLCSRCHLQGNTVLAEGKSFFDFKPGMQLEEVMNVFLPTYKDDDSFIMASHVDRLKMSECFLNSNSDLTCVTCHNPHVSVKETSNVIFNNACISCHASVEKHSVEQGKDCVSCHMPKSGSSDIPHVSVTDHKIAIHKNVSSTEAENIKEFIGLYCVNNSNPSDLTILKAYLQQYEKFEQESCYLDSALVYLAKLDEDLCVRQWIKYYFFSTDPSSLIYWFEKESFQTRKKQLGEQSYANEDAWTWYRIGESYYEVGKYKMATKSYKQACDLAPYHLDIQNKYAMSLMKAKRISEAQKVFEFILNENPNFEKAYANYGYLLSVNGALDQALRVYKKGLSLNPDISQLWLNLAAYYLHVEDLELAEKALNNVLRIEPSHSAANQLLNQLK